MNLRADGHQSGHNNATLASGEIVCPAGGRSVHHLKTDVRGMQKCGYVVGGELQSAAGSEQNQFGSKRDNLLNMVSAQLGRNTRRPVFDDAIGADNQAAGIWDIINDNTRSRICLDDISACGRGIQLYFHSICGRQPDDLTIKTTVTG